MSVVLNGARIAVVTAIAAMILLAAACSTGPLGPTGSPRSASPPATSPRVGPTVAPRATPSPVPNRTPTPNPTASPTPTPTPSPTPEPLSGTLGFAGQPALVPADGIASATLVASVQLASGGAAMQRLVHLRPTESGTGASASEQIQSAAGGQLTFTVSSSRPGQVTFGLYDPTPWSGDGPLATLEVEFTRKVVVLAPGFQSALARRFAIFGQPLACTDPANPRSINEALICLGFESDATIVDMAWEAAACRPADAAAEPPRRDCVATISVDDGGTVVLWEPADYDLADLALSMARQQQVDLWAHRLARTLVTYNEELAATTGTRASFYLVGHSLGGQVVVRALRAILRDDRLHVHFAGKNRGLLRAVVSVDGALNWSGDVQLISEPRCGLPVRTVPDAARAQDNADAVESAHAALGTMTVAMTSATDPIVTPDVALLRAPVPSSGYVEELHHQGGPDDGCSHSALLWPEPTGFPLRDLLETHIGPAAGD